MKKKYTPAIIGIPILFYLIISGLINNNKIEKNIENNKFETIGKVSKFYSNRSFSHYYFIYYYKNKKYIEANDLSSFGRERCIGKYYKINLSTENPHYSKIFLDQEVTDSIEIRNAGFRRE